MQNKSIQELTEDWTEVVKLSWLFPRVYELTLHNLRMEFNRRGIEIPKVEKPLEYLTTRQ
jgi:hypothetical protein